MRKFLQIQNFCVILHLIIQKLYIKIILWQLLNPLKVFVRQKTWWRK